MTDLPSGAYSPAPAGTPASTHQRMADVWCAHGVRWSHEKAGYLPVDQDPAHPDIPCLDAGAIPPDCQPVTPYDPADHPNAGPQAVADVRRELGY